MSRAASGEPVARKTDQEVGLSPTSQRYPGSREASRSRERPTREIEREIGDVRGEGNTDLFNLSASNEYLLGGKEKEYLWTLLSTLSVDAFQTFCGA